MDLNELYRAIPKDRDLRLSHSAHGIHFCIEDISTKKVISVQQMILGEELIRHGADVEKLFFRLLRDMNAAVDKELNKEARNG